MVRPLTLICTFRPLKPCGRFSGELTSQNVDEIFLTHDSALPDQCENTVSSHKTLRWTVLFHLPCSPDLAASDFHLFQALKDAIFEKSLAVMTRLSKNGCEYKIHTYTGRR
jgi:hypothetical protein